MKRQLDFVTNSSSCSFVGFGISMKSNEITDELDDKISKSELSYHSNDDYSFIGKTFGDMVSSPQKTINQHKFEVFEKLKELGLIKNIEEVEFIDEAWYNG